MKKKFKNYESYALVTGAASGMGRIYVRRLAMRGYNVIMVDINAQGLEETKALVTDEVSSSECIAAPM